MKLNIIKNRKKHKKKKIDQSNNDNTLLNCENLKKLIPCSEDIKYRKILINDNADIFVYLIYIDGLVNSTDISNFVIKPLNNKSKIVNAKSASEVVNYIKDGAISFASQSFSSDINEVADKIISGASILLFNSENIAFIFDTKGFEKRAMMEPTIENVNKGPRDSFVEDYRTNTATVRKKIKATDLMIEKFTVGERTKTNISIVYIKSIANDNIVNMAKNKIDSIKVDNVLTTSVIEDTLSDKVLCTFPQVVTTERPDKFTSDIIEGRVGIIVDGLPFGFVVPGTFNQFMQTPEDYSRKFVISTFIRLVRYISLIIAIFLPSIYVAITTFHLEMIPTNITLFIAKSREGVAFPVAIETIALLLSFEILFEAGLRIPKSIGQTVSIVGTLVVGQSAVEAKLVSPSIVVVIAMTIIASFTVPNQDLSNAIRIWRLICTIAGIFLGLLGVVSSIILLVCELCDLKSFGVCYMTPFVDTEGKYLFNDTFIKKPVKSHNIRPVSLNTKDNKRMGD